MPLQTETIDLEEEQERLQEEIDDANRLIEDMDDDHDRKAEVVELKNSLETQKTGVKWALEDAADADYCPAWDAAVDEMTLAGLTGGEVAERQDGLPADAGEGAVRVEFVAAGSPHPGDEKIKNQPGIDVPAPAPYVDANQTEEERLAVAARLPHPFQVWAHQRVDDLTSLSGNGRLDFDALRKRLAVTSHETSTPTT